jgi:hypothetical protein
MKLSELIKYRENLAQLRPQDPESTISLSLDPVRHHIMTHEPRFKKLAADLEQSRIRVSAGIQDYLNTLNAYDHEVQRQIDQLHAEYMARSYRIYEQEMSRDDVDVILNRKLGYELEKREYLRGRIAAQCDWKNPGMILRPAREQWILKLVGLDPLYIVDQSHDLLRPSITQFTPEYQRRLRPYIIRESVSGTVGLDLPDRQMGYALIYNFFNYKPMELIRAYMECIDKKMATGSIVHLTINDCDRSGGALLAESGYMCYTPGGMVISMLESMEYDLINSFHIDEAVTWLEFRKSGERISYRGGQTLAKIIDKSNRFYYNDDDVDTSNPKEIL